MLKQDEVIQYYISIQEAAHKSTPILEMYYSRMYPIAIKAISHAIELLGSALSIKNEAEFNTYSNHVMSKLGDVLPFINEVANAENIIWSTVSKYQKPLEDLLASDEYAAALKADEHTYATVHKDKLLATLANDEIFNLNSQIDTTVSNGFLARDEILSFLSVQPYDASLSSADTDAQASGAWVPYTNMHIYAKHLGLNKDSLLSELKDFKELNYKDSIIMHKTPGGYAGPSKELNNDALNLSIGALKTILESKIKLNAKPFYKLTGILDAASTNPPASIDPDNKGDVAQASIVKESFYNTNLEHGSFKLAEGSAKLSFEGASFMADQDIFLNATKKLSIKDGLIGASDIDDAAHRALAALNLKYNDANKLVIVEISSKDQTKAEGANTETSVNDPLKVEQFVKNVGAIASQAFKDNGIDGASAILLNQAIENALRKEAEKSKLSKTSILKYSNIAKTAYKKAIKDANLSVAEEKIKDIDSKIDAAMKAQNNVFESGAHYKLAAEVATAEAAATDDKNAADNENAKEDEKPEGNKDYGIYYTGSDNDNSDDIFIAFSGLYQVNKTATGIDIEITFANEQANGQ